jgi:hypothetical protein
VDDPLEADQNHDGYGGGDRDQREAHGAAERRVERLQELLAESATAAGLAERQRQQPGGAQDQRGCEARPGHGSMRESQPRQRSRPGGNEDAATPDGPLDGEPRWAFGQQDADEGRDAQQDQPRRQPPARWRPTGQ